MFRASPTAKPVKKSLTTESSTIARAVTERVAAAKSTYCVVSSKLTVTPVVANWMAAVSREVERPGSVALTAKTMASNTSLRVFAPYRLTSTEVSSWSVMVNPSSISFATPEPPLRNSSGAVSWRPVKPDASISLGRPLPVSSANSKPERLFVVVVIAEPDSVPAKPAWSSPKSAASVDNEVAVRLLLPPVVSVKSMPVALVLMEAESAVSALVMASRTPWTVVTFERSTETTVPSVKVTVKSLPSRATPPPPFRIESSVFNLSVPTAAKVEFVKVRSASSFSKSTSTPKPPMRTSSPNPPLILSSPAPPSISLFRSLPIMTSDLLVPITLWKPTIKLNPVASSFSRSISIPVSSVTESSSI